MPEKLRLTLPEAVSAQQLFPANLFDVDVNLQNLASIHFERFVTLQLPSSSRFEAFVTLQLSHLSRIEVFVTLQLLPSARFERFVTLQLLSSARFEVFVTLQLPSSVRFEVFVSLQKLSAGGFEYFVSFHLHDEPSETDCAELHALSPAHSEAVRDRFRPAQSAPAPLFSSHGFAGVGKYLLYMYILKTFILELKNSIGGEFIT